jgi:hypothetical protein
VKAVLTAPDPEATEAEKLARVAAALDYQRRIEAAIAIVQALREEEKEEPRASTTDADARVMKMAGGGFRPAYNIRLATAGSELGGPRTIVGLRVTNTGSDIGSVTAMLEDIKARTGKLPGQLLADANHAKHSYIETATRAGVEPIIAIPKHEQCATKPVSPEVDAWRERMKTDEGKRAYRAALHSANSPTLTSNAITAPRPFSSEVSRRSRASRFSGAIAANVLAHATAWLA